MTSLRRLALTVTAGLAMASAAIGAPQADTLSVCSQCLSPSVTQHSGYGTATATAEAHVTRADAESWCASWQPGDRACVRQQLASEEARQVYRASADCTRGRITAVDGQTYAYAGVWSNDDIGGGRSKWRDASGRIVGRDNASNGLAIAAQWELLCPKGVARAAGTPRAASAPVAAAAALFQPGQAIEAKYGRDWVRGRVTRLRPGAGGAVDYEVMLDNGRRGILPARMIRSVGR